MKKILTAAAFVMITLIHLVPLYLLVTIAFKSIQDVSSKWLIPSYVYLDNFRNAWVTAHLIRALFNNCVIATISVFLIVLLGSLASYTLSRYKTRLNRFVYTLFVSCMIVPALTILVPLYKMVADLGGVSTYWGISLTQVTFALPLTIFIYTGFVGTISRELDEAALIDGLSRYGVFFRIVFPLLKPVTVTVIIICGVNVWNDYTLSVFFLQKTDMRNMTVALSMFFSQFQSQVNWLGAGCLISALPLVILFLSLQRHFVKGLSSGAVKL
jgi:raffinose/stachyose/melibiose transport system permease protein